MSCDEVAEGWSERGARVKRARGECVAYGELWGVSRWEQVSQCEMKNKDERVDDIHNASDH